MNTHPDFEEFLRLLRDEGVEYVIVGGYAVAFHGYVRSTHDMDVFFRATDENVARLRRALSRFGINITDEQRQDFMEAGNILRLGVPPVRLEMINTISGLTFDEVWSRRVEGVYGDAGVNYISLPDLLKNKRAAGRPKDLADVDELGGNRGS